MSMACQPGFIPISPFRLYLVGSVPRFTDVKTVSEYGSRWTECCDRPIARLTVDSVYWHSVVILVAENECGRLCPGSSIYNGDGCAPDSDTSKSLPGLRT